MWIYLMPQYSKFTHTVLFKIIKMVDYIWCVFYHKMKNKESIKLEKLDGRILKESWGMETKTFQTPFFI